MAKPQDHTAELLQRIILDDEVSFNELYDIYIDRVFLFAYQLTKSKDIAGDMTQEVFIKLWEMRKEIDTALNFEAFLRTVTRNHVFNYLKKAARESQLQRKIFSGMQLLANTVEEQLLEKQLMQLHNEAVEKLPKQKKIIYILSRNEKLSHDQIAERMNLSRNTVKNHMVEALKFIRGYMSNSLGSTVIILIVPFF
ncbi:RNA polymerase sigma-70 factor [Niastella caeni]|uniref:RNA polymerase sigma-70 factor n=1 Tax=Niastella caeni TaxID=2569763 RepID=A0A4V4H1F2_9BACT|nr:RNA polymerase sigma-70 factor [Niastella caeni]THU40316.1 RNA polymerase sigma-70 factor [Niastella caeni]